MCETMSPASYLQTLEALGGESICNPHVHVTDCYRVWLGVRGLGRTIPKLKPESIIDVQEMRALFAATDLLVHEFLHRGQITKIARLLGTIPPKMNLSKIK